MTVSKLLAQGKNGKDDIFVYESFDKHAKNPHYEIVYSRNGIGYLTEKTAKTTWKKRFKEITD